ncbi:MAG: hypothetical protein HYU64_14690 [Armatimonadetes bacterium]|nr:hypothetical protein [Armatimonadota bacterium]
MCGIFGIVIKEKEKYKKRHVERLIKTLFLLSESRGKETAGLVVKGAGSLDVLKLPASASRFLKHPAYARLMDRVFSNIEKSALHQSLTIVGHARLVTHGGEERNHNNQPVIKGGMACVHNGIIANDTELWKRFPGMKREFEVDTEVFLGLLDLFLEETGSIASATGRVFEKIEGSATVAVLFNNNHSLLLATNTGSLYVVQNAAKDMMVFASERYILRRFADKARGIGSFDKDEIRQVPPREALIVDLKEFRQTDFALSGESAGTPAVPMIPHEETGWADHSPPPSLPHQGGGEVELLAHQGEGGEGMGTTLPNISGASRLRPETKETMTETWRRLYFEARLRRCTRCLLPETMTFIDFDEQGLCSYCRNHKRPDLKGEEALGQIAAKYRRKDGRPDCLVPYSGGRDSSYGLHYVKNVLKLNPIAFTYDWGVLTDLGRRNQARVCGKLGVEHIIISADIRRKRGNVKKNVEAWLRRPTLGTVPLFMAGDKELLYHADSLRKRYDINLVIYSYGNGLEDDLFKIGFSGVRMKHAVPFPQLPVLDKIRIAAHYGAQYVLNPGYINPSILDTLFAYYSVFVLPHDSVHLFNYVEWNEKSLLSTIMNEYGWEEETDTIATWRIDDGTAALYNYIYMTVAGLTEFDTFRSAQIRQGQIGRDESLALIREENRPRFESIEWYGRITGLDMNHVIETVNSIPKLYLYT